ncbi:hypothetical protein [Actinomadura atramentaria]|uniref:hypothetical protein n=1 Tax=Actinomadura atramentaria TaxID=1990 RepID=UPI0003644770|nr:hypothetical protein [Actinomadura atramentaria]
MAPRASSKRAGDLTGVRKEKLAKQHADEQAERAKEVALIDAAEAEPKLVDLTDDHPEPIEVEPAPELEKPTRTMRVNEKVEQMTFGSPHDVFDFEPGITYRVPTPLYKHLDEKGYVYH